MSPSRPESMPLESEARFERRFGVRPEAVYFSPGRINLIGEHTDYNGGWVLPIAIDLGNRLSVARNDNRIIRISSTVFPDLATIRLDETESLAPQGHWSDYIAGVVREFLGLAETSVGLDVLIDSTLPAGSGLSSSASITTGFATVLNEFWAAARTHDELVRLAQSAESTFVGVSCGILDPFAVATGRVGHAILLDCTTMAWEAVPLPVDEYAVVAVDSGVPRRLADSDYNQRREECERALSLLQRDVQVETLSELSPGDLAKAVHLLDDELAHRRARHVVTENARVLTAAAALKAGDMRGFGNQLVASHRSLKNDFDVSCAELDIMVDEATALDGVVGAKMTGAGFGGSIVAVVENDAVAVFAENLAARYRRKTRYDAVFRICRPAAGVCRLPG